MYCNKCGKQIETGTLCRECALADAIAKTEQKEFVEATVLTHEPENLFPDPHNRMFGFGKALASTIMSTIGFFLSYAAIIATIESPGAALVLTLLSVPLAVLPLIWGINSIKLFKTRAKTCAKPIPTLVLGIYGVAMAGMTAFFSFLSFILSMAMM